MPSDTDQCSTGTPQRTQGTGPPVDDQIDLDALRGWSEDRDPQLQMAPRLPVLAELLALDDDDTPRSRYSLQGPELLLGRFQSQYAPVDIAFSDLADHQSYRLGAPHIHLSHRDQDQWQLKALSPHCRTVLNDQIVSHLHNAHPLADGDRITLGVTVFLFRTGGVTVDQWRQAEQQLLDTVDTPTLFLKRRGGICGPCRELTAQKPLVLGRSHPAPGELPKTENWPEIDANRWDLSGVYDDERKHIAFRHAQLRQERNQWTIRPLSSRRRTFVNRIAISGTTPLESGDEIGLGSVLFRFHHPQQSDGTTSRPHVPTVVDWSEGRPPSVPASESD